jgi:hypothetical protein
MRDIDRSRTTSETESGSRVTQPRGGPFTEDRARLVRTRSSANRRGRARLLALALGCLLALGVFCAWLSLRRGAHGDVEFHDKRADFAQAWAARYSTLAADPKWHLDDRDPLALPKQTARLLFTVDVSGNVYEPNSYFCWEPNRNLMVQFPGYPGGQVAQRTNSLGMREDVEVLVDKPDLRLLITGDSHTDGSCANSESYTNRLEALLSESFPGRTIEGLNAGKGGYSFYNYLGVARRFADLNPDVFIVGVFGGNDFEEVLFPWHYFSGTERPLRSNLQQERIMDALQDKPGAFAQGLLQLLYFQEHPKERDVALTAAVGLSAQIAGFCRARGIRPLFLYIPPCWLLEPTSHRELFASLGIGDRDVELTGELADRWLESLLALGIPAHDLRPAFREDPSKLYWRDEHINLMAHEIIARQLVPLVTPLLK